MSAIRDHSSVSPHWNRLRTVLAGSSFLEMTLSALLNICKLEARELHAYLLNVMSLGDNYPQPKCFLLSWAQNYPFWHELSESIMTEKAMALQWCGTSFVRLMLVRWEHTVWWYVLQHFQNCDREVNNKFDGMTCCFQLGFCSSFFSLLCLVAGGIIEHVDIKTTPKLTDIYALYINMLQAFGLI